MVRHWQVKDDNDQHLLLQKNYQMHSVSDLRQMSWWAKFLLSLIETWKTEGCAAGECFKSNTIEFYILILVMNLWAQILQDLLFANMRCPQVKSAILQWDLKSWGCVTGYCLKSNMIEFSILIIVMNPWAQILQGYLLFNMMRCLQDCCLWVLLL